MRQTNSDAEELTLCFKRCGNIACQLPVIERIV